jgi:hypothetical protein
MTDIVSERAISFALPKQCWFRFENCAAYKHFSSSHLKEMDVVWYDSQQATWWLVECKDFTKAHLETRESLEHWIDNLAEKTSDVLFMFAAVHLAKNDATNLGRCFPKQPTNNDHFIALTVVLCRKDQETAVLAINDAYKRKVKGRCALMDVAQYSVVSHRQAKAWFSWIL